MKIFDIIILSFAAVCLIIGMHQSSINGFADSYWIFMLMLTFFGIYLMRKGSVNKKEQPSIKKRGGKSLKAKK